MTKALYSIKDYNFLLLTKKTKLGKRGQREK